MSAFRDACFIVLAISSETILSWRDVFLLFVIPGGGGIPAGALLAKARGIDWPMMTGLYFISDVLLAFLFEPMMTGFIWLTQRFQFFARLRDAIKKSTSRTLAGFGASPGPFLLVVIAFGVDPMTGRAAAKAAGHGFFTGWAIAIIGDMLSFALIATSTLYLSSILGDGTWAAVIIMIAMVGIPALIKKFKASKL